MKKSVVSVGVAALGALALANPVLAVTPTGVVATGKGVAGMQQTVSVLAPGQTRQSVGVTATQGQFTQRLTVNINRVGVGQVRWTPPTSGSWTMTASNGSIQSTTASVAPMPTVTQIAVPTNPTHHRPSPFVATI